MGDRSEALRKRLARLGMHFDSAQLRHTEARLDAHSATHEELHDAQLLTIAVDAYISPESSELV